MKSKHLYPSSRFFTDSFEKSTIDDKKQSSFAGSSNEDPKSTIRNNFTFKRRSIKQKIISRLDKFIGEIDDESHCSRKENHYYNKEINKL